jgi:BirA family biotin operon repressor/biotin-[acetyl-CoA-carboxylase] ligase
MNFGIKWPNDIVLNGKKICGILTEMSLEKNRIGHVVIGVGINVKNQDFPEELVDKATSLEAECGKEFSRSHILQEIMRVFEEEYEHFLLTEDLSGIMERYNAGLINRGREVRVLDPQGEYNGVARGINNGGELIVELADGTLTNVYAGEVSVRGIYGYV